MSGKTLAIAAAVLVYVVAGFFAAEYIAGGAYFLVNKTMPVDITLDTWLQYWNAYGTDPVQKKRLQMAAIVAGVIVYLVPLLILNAVRIKTRSLHGDARWATAGEIRKAGLL
jgi:type IV secretion system protein VirD4